MTAATSAQGWACLPTAAAASSRQALQRKLLVSVGLLRPILAVSISMPETFHPLTLDWHARFQGASREVPAPARPPASRAPRCRSRRMWKPNVHNKRLYSHILDSMVRLRVTTAALR